MRTSCHCLSVLALLVPSALVLELPAQIPHPLDPNQIPLIPGLGVHLNGIGPHVSGTFFIQCGDALHGTGDFNGDGYADVIIGAPGADPPSGNDRGEAYLVLGIPELGTGGIFDMIDLDGVNGLRLQGYEETLLGGSLSGAGDVNGDGLSDVLIGFAGVTSSTDAGAAYLVWGTSEELGENGIFSLADLDGANGVRISADGLGLSYFGRTARGVGDLNSDGLSDLAIASRNDAIVLLYGRAGGYGAGGLLDITSLDGTEGILITGALGSGMSGAGDVDGDGIDDLLFSDTGESPRVIHLIAGSTAGIGTGGLFDLEAGLSSGEVRMEGTVGDLYGADLAGIGDLNGDGLDDMVIGAPGPSDSLGRLFVVFGDESLFDTTTHIDLEVLSPPQGLILTGVAVDDRVGLRVAGGDVNGDGWSDLLASVEGAQQCYIIYGQSGGVAPALVTSLSNLDGANGVRVINTPPFQEISSVGDFNGDGITDLLISHDTGTGGALPGELPTGECFLFHGVASSTSATYRTHIRAGDAPAKAIGALADGSHPLPPSRCSINHDEGSGPGKAGSSLETVTLTRDGSSISNLASPELVADVMWSVSTNRAGQTSTRLTFHYLASETASLEEADLRLYHALSPTGPWSPATPMALNVNQNQIVGTVSSLSSPEYFAIAATGGTLGVDTDAILAHLLGITSDPMDLDVNWDRRVDVGDLAFNVNVGE
jgi:FG-GAP repeat protein